jgi:hypothetical protein
VVTWGGYPCNHPHHQLQQDLPRTASSGVGCRIPNLRRRVGMARKRRRTGHSRTPKAQLRGWSPLLRLCDSARLSPTPPLVQVPPPQRPPLHPRVSSTPKPLRSPCSARRRCTPSYRGPRAGSSAAAGPPRPRRRTCKSPAPRPAPQPRFVSLSLLCFSGVCSSPPRCVSSAIGVGCSEDRRGLGAGGMIT